MATTAENVETGIRVAHVVGDVCGVFGIQLCDPANAIVYFVEKRYAMAAISLAGVVPIAGEVAVGAKLASEAPKATKAVGTLDGTVNALKPGARGVDVEGANFAQRNFSETFSAQGALAGRTIDDVAGDLRSGAMSPSDIPIDVIVRDGNTLILNTRSSQALIRAEVPRSSWTVVTRTGDSDYERRLCRQLRTNGLTSTGVRLE